MTHTNMLDFHYHMQEHYRNLIAENNFGKNDGFLFANEAFVYHSRCLENKIDNAVNSLLRIVNVGGPAITLPTNY